MVSCSAERGRYGLIHRHNISTKDVLNRRVFAVNALRSIANFGDEKFQQ
jgi:hypothetical protein